jgi:hypothetical protein
MIKRVQLISIENLTSPIGQTKGPKLKNVLLKILGQATYSSFFILQYIPMIGQCDLLSFPKFEEKHS